MDASLILFVLKLVNTYGKAKTLRIIEVFIELKQQTTGADQSELREQLIHLMETI